MLNLTWMRQAHDLPCPVGKRVQYSPRGGPYYIDHPREISTNGSFMHEGPEITAEIKLARSLVQEYCLRPSTKSGRAKLAALLVQLHDYAVEDAEELANSSKVRSKSAYWGQYPNETIYPVYTANEWKALPRVVYQLSAADESVVQEVLSLVRRFNINPNEAHNYRGLRTSQQVISVATQRLYEDPLMHFKGNDSFQFTQTDGTCPREGRPDRYGYRCCGPIEEHYRVEIIK